MLSYLSFWFFCYSGSKSCVILTRNSVIVPIHLGARAVTDEEFRFRSGRHLAAVLATIAFKILILCLNPLRGIYTRAGDSD